MNQLTLDTEHILPFIGSEAYDLAQKDMHYHHRVLTGRTGKGSDFLGWLDLPENQGEEMLVSMDQDVRYLKERAGVIVVVGIGGSYLGARAVIEALTDPFLTFDQDRKTPLILYAGHHLSEEYHASLLRFLESRPYAVVVISKSGTTTEPAVAFRLLKEHLEKKHGKPGARERIIAVTDGHRGALKTLADTEGYKMYVIPDDVGGRYSVLSPVGLLPVALAGVDVWQMLQGASAMRERCFSSSLFQENPAAAYAALRNLMYRQGKPVEIMVNFNPQLAFFAEWWKQLYGESEGKEKRGIFPAAVACTTDLHSMGQYIQDGLRILFETVLSVEEIPARLAVPDESQNLDGLNFLAGMHLSRINGMAETGTILAHVDGGVPVMRVRIPFLNAWTLGEMIYFFEFACALSGSLLDVNPFDQPGVEAYKKNMFALLGKPGFEHETLGIRQRLNRQ